VTCFAELPDLVYKHLSLALAALANCSKNVVAAAAAAAAVASSIAAESLYAGVLAVVAPLPAWDVLKVA